MKRFVIRRLITALCVTGALGISTSALASAFQIWEQDGASIGDYHAGYAALANDASTGWYNPAGLTRIKNQQIIVGADVVMSDFKYKGSVGITEATPKLIIGHVPPLVVTPSTFTFPAVTAQGGKLNVVPSLHYATPLTDWLGFGFNIDVPFGLQTNYGNSTPLKFAATLSSITVIDVSPSLGIKILDRPSLGIGSIGVGFDVQRTYAEFDTTGVLLTSTSLINPNYVPGLTGSGQNKANDTGYGYHLGALYEFTPDARVGISYHSQVVHHLTGFSEFSGPIAKSLNGGPFRTGHTSANLTLPPYTALSVYYRVVPKVALMGSVIYTQWSTFNRLLLKNVAAVVSVPTNPLHPVAPSKTVTVNIPANYHNTWNFIIGTEYYATSKITVRAGVGYDQTPVTDKYRNVQLPDNNRYVIALGGHYQATKAVGYDLGWTHFFIGKTRVNPAPQVLGGQTVTTNGHVTGGADVIGGQVVWDIV